MLGKDALDHLGKVLRKQHDERPKGGIPDPIWRLLLAIEAACRPVRPATPSR